MNSKLENKSTDDLIQLSLTESNDRLQSEYIVTLQYRATIEVLNGAERLCKSNNIKNQEIGIRILGQLGIPERAFPNECLDILLQLWQTETNSDILCDVGIALGHLGDSKAISSLVKYKNHSHADVRYGVVSGLLGQENSQAVEALVELSGDIDEDVRNWATFGLGSQIEIDTDKIREALWQRLLKEPRDTEISHEIYGEALVGLAIRKDRRVIKPLLAELQSNCVGVLAVEAAEEIGDRRLYNALIELKEWWDCDLDMLDRAIESCR